MPPVVWDAGSTMSSSSKIVTICAQYSLGQASSNTPAADTFVLFADTFVLWSDCMLSMHADAAVGGAVK
jgi:hypothetical protein